jgi:hypothetical protein
MGEGYNLEPRIWKWTTVLVPTSRSTCEFTVYNRDDLSARTLRRENGEPSHLKGESRCGATYCPQRREYCFKAGAEPSDSVVSSKRKILEKNESF